MPDVRYMPCRPAGQPGSDDSDINTLMEPPWAGLEEAGQALQSVLLWTEFTLCSLAQESVELKNGSSAPVWQKPLFKAFLNIFKPCTSSGTTHTPGGVVGNILVTASRLPGQAGGRCLPVESGLTAAMEVNG